LPGSTRQSINKDAPFCEVDGCPGPGYAKGFARHNTIVAGEALAKTASPGMTSVGVNPSLILFAKMAASARST
jgi:hypothetical protein